ncbi:hypothetical protein Pst134EA_018944 [Puccinia striiformis f. sp. tritici]|uniref:Uncharacterized protein n=2 Tax=Puccinia striiformis f. sp. tritici TaxID=168172 RepID=A0A0L0UT92_9BASI|nr:hypothetical protein Pst134EA_018944 [Puccinia striiformis f. sp. tritici]KAH9458788.1 hypothetical protein Pst134EA_018944 [Puccinia striiformis f. sp. tritici]KNE90263.1 hypothetical protein PSTG_16304 [Puccinia striiformis f. sp. tritici PST-78]
MAMGFLNNKLFSSFGQYPITKEFSNQRITPILMISCGLVYAGLLAFNILTQGHGETSESLLLSYPENSIDESGTGTSCGPASLRLSDDIYTVETGNAENDPEGLGVAQSPGSFQWTIGDISRSSDAARGKVYTGFLYDGDPMSCNVTSASFTYQFLDTNYKYSLCGLCFIPTYKFRVKLCTTFDLSTTNLPNFAKDLQLSLQNRLGNIDSAYGSLTFEPHTLPLSGFPPYYSSDQPDVYGNRTFTSNDFTQLTIWIGDINFVPSPNNKPVQNNDHSDGTPQGNIFVHRDNKPSDFLSAFKTTGDASASGFQFSVLGIGGVRPLGAQLNLGSNVPAPLSDLFHNSLSTLGWMMNAASADLNGRSIGTTYLCTKTRRKWKPFITLASVAIGSSSGVFGACLAAMIFLARKYDERNPDNDVEAGHDPEDSDERRRVSKVSQIPLIKSS